MWNVKTKVIPVIMEATGTISKSLRKYPRLYSLIFLLLNQWWTPSFRLQVSPYKIFCIMCDVPSIAVHCSEYTEHFPGMASKFFFKPFVTIPVTNYYWYDHTFQVPEMLHL